MERSVVQLIGGSKVKGTHACTSDSFIVLRDAKVFSVRNTNPIVTTSEISIPLHQIRYMYQEEKAEE